ncbi:MAG: hypothetical protein OEV93_03775 [Candidatus Moranbacteria bacterium]|nr:hypothetical protein [Candidatus Moranbacteria bacterium]
MMAGVAEGDYKNDKNFWNIVAQRDGVIRELSDAVESGEIDRVTDLYCAQGALHRQVVKMA